MGFDSRVAGALLGLGYRIFPFEAFDETGRVKTGEVDYPQEIREGLGRIVANPMWVDLYRTMSVLQSHHRVFMAGIGLVNDRVQVAVIKGTATVGGPAEAMNWARNYHDTIEDTLHRYAGTSYLIDPKWHTILDKARAGLPAGETDVEIGDTQATFAIADDEGPPGAETAIAAVPWLKFGLDLLAELVTKMTVRTKVLTTVVWFPKEVADASFASRWPPIHATLQKGVFSGHRSAHLIWNPVGFPVTWKGESVSWRGPGMNMPHEPVRWCQALRPLANCAGRAATLASEPDAEQAVAAAQPATASA